MSFFNRTPDVPTLTPDEFVAQRQPGAPLLDVRTPAEYDEGHLEGAVNVDVQAPDFADRIAAMNLPTDTPVYLHCKAGSRSARATEILHQMGHTGAVNVGGYEALRAAGVS